MFALGCIQSQTCHTGRCPTGVATQDTLRQQALVVPDKAERVFQFYQATLAALKVIVQAAGLQHPQDISAFHISRRVSESDVRLLANVVPHVKAGFLLDVYISEDHKVYKNYWNKVSADSFGLQHYSTTALQHYSTKPLGRKTQ